jgi:acyl-CoA synthetase (AMP-forming)/AMP-acid ligase II
MRRFNPELFLQLIEKHQINMAYLVPPVILFLGNDPLVEQYDIGSLEYILSGAAPLGEEQSLSISARIQCPIVQGYGLTEASPVTHRIPDKLGNTRQGSIGVLVPNAEAMIVDVISHQPLPVGESGELLIRSPQVMKGYLDNPEATAATINADGWLQTGDIGYVDEAGYFYIADRLKELIKYNAYQVAPAELEALLLTHDDILDAAVVPTPDPKAGEIPKAFIVLHKDGVVSAEQIMQWTADRIASYKKIRSVEFIEQIPKSPSGKILRRLLRDKH